MLNKRNILIENTVLYPDTILRHAPFVGNRHILTEKADAGMIETADNRTY